MNKKTGLKQKHETIAARKPGDWIENKIVFDLTTLQHELETNMPITAKISDVKGPEHFDKFTFGCVTWKMKAAWKTANNIQISKQMFDYTYYPDSNIKPEKILENTRNSIIPKPEFKYNIPENIIVLDGNFTDKQHEPLFNDSKEDDHKNYITETLNGKHTVTHERLGRIIEDFVDDSHLFNAAIPQLPDMYIWANKLYLYTRNNRMTVADITEQQEHFILSHASDKALKDYCGKLVKDNLCYAKGKYLYANYPKDTLIVKVLDRVAPGWRKHYKNT